MRADREAELFRLVARVRAELIDEEGRGKKQSGMKGMYRTLLHQVLDNIEETQDVCSSSSSSGTDPPDWLQTAPIFPAAGRGDAACTLQLLLPN